MRNQTAKSDFSFPKRQIFKETSTMKTIVFVLILLLAATITDGRKKLSRCKCNSKTFACTQGSFGNCACLPLSFKCDGDYDCGDFSDERDCPSSPCPTDRSSGWFQCDNGQCIKESWKCDGDNDCVDDSDERGCKVECEEEDRLCVDGKKCISPKWWCDGDEDCDDGSDELSCVERNCTEEEFKCKSGECIKKEYVCDPHQDFDCRDGSDEEDCVFGTGPVSEVIPYNNSCREDEYPCTRLHGDEVIVENCIHTEYMCDGDYDCDSGDDEKDCERPCTSEEYTCANRKCINLHNHCDGTDDCGDGSDEECGQEICNDGEFRCDNGICISKNWRCDGDSDCKDGSDERGCIDPTDTCDGDQFECYSGKRCISSSWRCDDQADCEDGSDELYCNCSMGQYQCKSGECIAMGKLCNGIPDCSDLSDEKPIIACNFSLISGNISSCSGGFGGCEHGCKENEVGQKMCVCQDGFRLASDMRSCEDFNECNVEGSCSQMCNNTIGSFSCSCLSGYELRPDGRTCKASGPPPALLFTNRIDIRRMIPDRSEFQPIQRNLENAIGLDYHIKHQLMFWSDVTLDKIMRSNINGSGEIQEVVSSGLESPGDVAVDWIHNLLYWTDSRTSRIEVAWLDGKNRKVLIWEELQRPRALALHPLKGLMFWTDWGNEPYLGCAAMDGSMRKHLATTDVYWPNGLTIDYTTDQIYWIDAKYHIIETASLDGGNRRPVISSGLRHPFGITLFEDKIYWTDWQTKSVNTANKFTGGGVRTIRNRLFFPMNIRTYHPLRQPEGENKCKNANCSHLCLPNPQNYTCACPTGFRRVGATQCAEEIESFLVFTRKTDIRRISFDAPERADIVLQLDGLKNAVGLDWHTGYLYWSDIGLDTISRCNWDGTDQKVLIGSSLDSPAGIAIDWITNKIYWTDSGLNRIEVAMLDGSMRSVLAWTNLDRPRDIIVHPKTGHMFWTDWGDLAKIERAGMDGSQRTTIVSTELKYPNGIAIDNVTERIYWVDAGTKKLESCDVNGGKRMTILATGLEHPFGITLNETRVFWTDWSTKKISYANKDDGSDQGFVRKELPFLMDVRYYHKYRYQTPNPCSILNGGCSHLCLLAPVTDDNELLNVYNTPYSCACPTGLVLNADRRTCNSNMNKFLVIARRLDIYVISLDVPYSADVKLHINSYMNNVVDVAVDPVEGHLYWSDIGSNKISCTVLSDSPGNETVVVDSGLVTVDGLAVDVDGRLLYWTDDGKDSISVARLDGRNRRVLINDNLVSPRAIALHYELGYMYWTDWGNNPSRIERAGLDGSNRSVIISSNLTWPNGLTIDFDKEWLIWGDAQSEKIEASDLLGRNRRTLYSSVQHPYSLTTLDGYLYWTDWQTRNIEQLNLHNTSQHRVARENMPSMMGIKAVQMNVTSNNRCGSNNGGCSHLCLRSPMTMIGYVCACPTGVQLQTDGKTCSNLPSEYLLFTSRRSIQRLSLEADIDIPVELPVKNLENAIALDYHYRRKLLFYTDVYLDVIRSSNLDGSDVRTLISKDLKTMDGLAVDWIANNFYWTDAGLNTINVARLDGSNRKVIVDHRLDEPRAICAHPPRGAIFWTDWGGKPRIEKSFMDGTTRKVLVQKNLFWPNGLTIDYLGGKLFWVDAHHLLNRIESCDLNGKGRKVVVSPVPHGFAITYLYDTIYWTDWHTRNIHSATLSGKNKRKVVLKGFEELMGIKAVSASRQTGTSLCDSTKGYGRCLHLCLMRGPNKFICATPDVIEVENASVSVLPDSSSATVTTTTAMMTLSKTKELNPTQSTSSLMTSSNAKKSLGAVPNAPSTGHFVGVLVGAALTVFVISIGVALIICRRLKKKKQNLESVSFRNRTYEGTSSSTLTDRRTPLTTPSPSLRASSEESEPGHEEKSFLLESSAESRNPKSRQKVAKVTPVAVNSKLLEHKTKNGISTDFHRPLLIKSSLSRSLMAVKDEDTDNSESENHTYASIGEASGEQNLEDTDTVLAESPVNSGLKSPADLAVEDDLTSLSEQLDQISDPLTETPVDT